MGRCNAVEDFINKKTPDESGVFLERVVGVEPTSSVWKTEIITAIRYPRTKCSVHEPKKDGKIFRGNKKPRRSLFSVDGGSR